MAIGPDGTDRAGSGAVGARGGRSNEARNDQGRHDPDRGKQANQPDQREDGEEEQRFHRVTPSVGGMARARPEKVLRSPATRRPARVGTRHGRTSVPAHRTRTSVMYRAAPGSNDSTVNASRTWTRSVPGRQPWRYALTSGFPSSPITTRWTPPGIRTSERRSLASVAEASVRMPLG